MPVGLRSMSCATMRTRSPARRTLPSSTVVAPSAAPISWRVCSRFLKRITEEREITLSAWILESCAMTSSVIPSAKYSFSGSALRLRKGSTATDADASRGRDAARARLRRRRAQPLRERHHLGVWLEIEVGAHAVRVLRGVLDGADPSRRPRRARA